MIKTCMPLVLVLLTSALQAHDTWVQTNVNVVRAGNNIHIDLMLGNHGNDHRDFKLAGKLSPSAAKLEVIAPDGKRYDLKERLVDRGYTPAEGFWTASFVGVEPGIYLASHFSDQVVTYAPKRSIKSAKTYFVVSPSLDKVSETNPGFEKPIGHPLELVPVANPVTPMGPGAAIHVQLIYKGKPLSKTKVSFIPRGETLSEEFDERFERLTDEEGRAAFVPTAGNYYLVVAHHDEPNETGKGYESVKYSATLTVLVPQICPCCGE